MARPTVWRRSQNPATGAVHANGYTLAALGAGETMTRCRLHLDVSSLNANEYVFTGVPIVWGIVMVTLSVGTDPDPFTDMNTADWLWWEGIALRNQVAEGTGAAKYVDSGPFEGGYRDIRAMRKADPTHGSNLRFLISASPLVPTLTLFTQVTSSTLVTLP